MVTDRKSWVYDPAMPLTPDEQAELSRLTAKAAEPAADPEPVVEAAGEVAGDVGAATAEAVGEAAAAAAAAVAEHTDPPAPVVVTEPDPMAEARAAALVIDAQAEADIRREDAALDRELAVHEQLHDHEQERREAEAGNIIDDTLGPIVDELASDTPPKPVHGWFAKKGR